MDSSSDLRPFYEVHGDRLRVNFHADQRRAMDARKRFVLVSAGTQSGKTLLGPSWLWREIRTCGPGDYLVVSPHFTLLELKALPAFRHLFEDLLCLGSYRSSPVRHFRFSNFGVRKLFGDWTGEPTAVYFGYAANPDSIESATAKAIWNDESGQKAFKLESWEAEQRRTAIYLGRILQTTTPYNLGWLYKKLYLPGRDGNHPDIDVINFRSDANPYFPKSEMERARRELPAWKFNMFYRGLFERPAGLIYDCFSSSAHTCPRFEIPADWPRFMGLDFGGTHLAVLFLAKSPSGRFYVYREYLSGKKTAKDHTTAFLQASDGLPVCVGGAWSEGSWRLEFRAAGLPVEKPSISDVETGISWVYAAIQTGQVVVFDDLSGLLDEIETYSRPVDEEGNPTDGIEDKHTYHRLDSLRYIGTKIFEPSGPSVPSVTVAPVDPLHNLSFSNSEDW